MQLINMNQTLKIIPVFLKLKCQEIWNLVPIILAIVGTIVGIVAVGLFIGFGLDSSSLWVCFASCYITYLCYLFIFGFILFFVCCIVIGFCQWIHSNWEKAKLIVEHNEISEINKDKYLK